MYVRMYECAVAVITNDYPIGERREKGNARALARFRSTKSVCNVHVRYVFLEEEREIHTYSRRRIRTFFLFIYYDAKSTVTRRRENDSRDRVRDTK